ncbi:MAG: iron-containing alcohol dehydrogenase, partial [Phycisphaerae bacterium]|nr:iron-containing alcohol dehydrogenase [Phycisphaerae bacterium]
LIGAHLAGAAIERSMLGAAHACANPLTARFGVVHGVAVGLMLPHVVRFNGDGDANPYADLWRDAGELAARLDAMLVAARLPRRLSEIGVPPAALPELAMQAARQWTAQFNPRPVREAECLAIYRAAAGDQ